MIDATRKVNTGSASDGYGRGYFRMLSMQEQTLQTISSTHGFYLTGTADEFIKRISREVWKELDTKSKTDIARTVFFLLLIRIYITLREESDIPLLREVQKILFSTRDKKLEEAIEYIDQMYDENDNSFEKRLATTKPGGKKTEYAIEISHKNAVDSAFRILTLKLHPDKGGDTELFQILQEMHDHLVHVDLEQDDIDFLDQITRSIPRLQVLIEQDFRIIRKILQGEAIPKEWNISEKTIKKMADDGVDTSPFL